MLARPHIVSMSDAQHYVSNTTLSTEPLSDYKYQLRLACLNNGDKTKLFSQRPVKREPKTKVAVAYNQLKVLDWPFQGLTRDNARHYNSLLDAHKGRLAAIVADDSGSVAFQLADQTVFQPDVDFIAKTVSINAQSMETICCTSLGSVVAITADLQNVCVIFEEEERARTISASADPTNEHFSVVTSEDRCAGLIDSRLRSNASIVYKAVTRQSDGIAKISPSGSSLFCVQSTTQQVIELFDVRIDRSFQRFDNCIAGQWMPNSHKTFTTVERNGIFNNCCTLSGRENAVSVVAENALLGYEVVDFCWNSTEKLILAFLEKSDASTCPILVRSVADSRCTDSEHWQTIRCDRDCIDFCIDRHDERDRVYLGSSCETISIFDFIKRKKMNDDAAKSSKFRLLPRKTINYTIR